MTEENNTGGAPAEAAPAAMPPAADSAPPAPDGAAPPSPAADTPAPAADPVDWRKEIAGEDEKLFKQLERFGSLKDFHKSYQEATQRIREGFKSPELPENPTDEQVIEYRKLIGVPNTPEEYKFNLGEGMVIGEADKPIWDLFLKEANAMNMTQAEFDKVAPAYYKLEAALKEQQEADTKELVRKNESELRGVWGTDYQANMTINENFLTKEGGDALKETLLYGVAPDGSPLMNNPVVAKFLNDMARMQGFSDGMAYNSEGNASSVADEIKSLLDKRTGPNREAYYKDRSQVQKDTTRLNELMAMQQKFQKNA